MSTAVTANQAPDVPGGAPATGFTAYKPGEGYATRLGIMVVVMAYVGFACHHWYYNWVFLRDFFDPMFTGIGLGVITRWMQDSGAIRVISATGTALIAGIGFVTAYYFIYVKRNSAEFLIKTDAELGKVTWPKVFPLFKVDTQVWGATYVVLMVVFLLTVYVFGVDSVLQQIARLLFYR